MTNPRVAENLKRLRKRNHWSQKKLSVLSGVSQPMICAIEAGRRGCTDATAELLARALGVSVPDLRSGRCGHCEGTPPAGYACMTCGRKGESCPVT